MVAGQPPPLGQDGSVLPLACPSPPHSRSASQVETEWVPQAWWQAQAGVVPSAHTENSIQAYMWWHGGCHHVSH